MSFEQIFFKSSAALAQHFEERAGVAEAAQKNAKTQRDAAISLREAVTWRAAAELARTVGKPGKAGMPGKRVVPNDASAKPRYQDAQKQKLYASLLSLAADRSSEMYHLGRPHRGAAHRTAFWDGYAGLKMTANVVPGTLSAVAYAAGKQFAKTNPGIAKDEAVWTPGVTRQGEPTAAR